MEDIESFETFKTGFPILKPLLKILGVDTSSIENAFGDIQNLAQEIMEFSEIPDRFNDLLSNRGWIMFERMNMDIAKEAVIEAEQGNFESAEEILVEYFNPDFVERELKTMLPVTAYRPRMELTEKAMEDYRDQRYHACIPVVLAQIDGLVSDLHEKQRGFFAENTNLEAWDSLAAHSKGLNQLSAILRKGRKRTVSESISVPYRHGIVHGRDLGYANQIVAAKSWAALFAVREWALKVERDELEAPPEEPGKSWRETLESIVETNQETERWKNWSPRIVSFENTGDSPLPEQFTKTTPERTLVEYLKWWSVENYGYMSKYIPQIFSKYAEKPLPLQIRNVYDDKKLQGYTFKGIDHSIPSLAIISVNLIIFTDGKTSNLDVDFRMIYETDDGDFVAYGNPSGRWVIMNWNSI